MYIYYMFLVHNVYAFKHVFMYFACLHARINYYICMHVGMHVYICMHACICVYTCACMNICMHACVYFVQLCMHIDACTCMT